MVQGWQHGKVIDVMAEMNAVTMDIVARTLFGADVSGDIAEVAGAMAVLQEETGRVSATVTPNIVFTEDLAGNPTAEVEVRAAVDGTIVSRRLLKSSGSKSWDDAVLKAIDKTEVLPRDVDGRIPPLLVISFRPRD